MWTTRARIIAEAAHPLNSGGDCPWPGARLVSPSVDALRDSHPVVTIALSSGTGRQLADYANQHELGFNIVNDPDGDISRAWGVAVTPTLAVVHRGQIRSMTSGVTTPPGISLRLWMSGLLGSVGSAGDE